MVKNAQTTNILGANPEREALQDFASGFVRAAEDGATIGPALEAELRRIGADDDYILALRHEVSPRKQHEMMKDFIRRAAANESNIHSLDGEDPHAGLPENPLRGGRPRDGEDGP